MSNVNMSNSLAPLYSMVCVVAEELVEINSVYGEDCLSFVKAMLQRSSNPRWEEVIYSAVKQWTMEHPRLVLDLDT